MDSRLSNENIAANTTLTKKQRLSVWAGVGGAVIGCTAWLIAMAALSGDWLTVGLTLVLDVAALLLFGQLCLQHARNRFLYLSLLLVILTAHCLAMYWWRLDLWRSDMDLAAGELASQKKTVTFTVGAMVLILLAQVMLMHFLSRKGRRRGSY